MTTNRGRTPGKSARVLGVIPARYASTRFPGKPLFEIAGKPLLRRVWERCQRARSIDRLVIATDDARIWRAASSWGAEVVLTSKEHPSGTDRVAEVARSAKSFSSVINIQGDEPMIDPVLIDRLVAHLHKPGVELVTAAHPFENPRDIASPNQVKVVIDQNGRALYFSRAPIPFARNKANPLLSLRHQGIYAFRRETLLRFVKWKPTPLEQVEALEQLRALENGVTVHVLVTNAGSPGVDTPSDAAALEKIIARAEKRGASK
jgi:3-deoxy-manno-octulosonate cytidylyltransferase (CMP-KDO synthetase)